VNGNIQARKSILLTLLALTARAVCVLFRGNLLTVYFLRRKSNGEIKIGTSRNPLKRVKNLEHKIDDNLEVLCIIRGGVNLERQLHERFCEYHVRNEWFFPGKKIIDFITELIRDGKDIKHEPERLIESEVERTNLVTVTIKLRASHREKFRNRDLSKWVRDRLAEEGFT
jgi:hypothetical protein